MSIQMPYLAFTAQRKCFPVSKGVYKRSEKKINITIGESAERKSPAEFVKNVPENGLNFIKEISGGDMDIPRYRYGNSLSETGFDYEESNY